MDLPCADPASPWPGRTRRARIAALLLSALSILPARAESLNTVMDWALRSSFDVKAAEARQAAAEAQVLGTMEAFLPTVSYLFTTRLDSKLSYTPDFTTLSGGPAAIDTIARRQANIESFQLSLPLFDGFKRYNEMQAARSAAEAQAVLLADRTQQILVDTASAYLAVLRDRRIVVLRREGVADVAKVARNVAAKFKVRDATATDVALADSRISAAMASLEQARANLQSSEIELARLAGPAARASSFPRVPDELVPATLDALRTALLADNPKLVASRLDTESARFGAKTAYAHFLPQVNLLFSHTLQGPVSSYPYKIRDTSTMLQARIPIYDPLEFSDVARGNAIAQQKGYESLDLERSIVAQASAAFLQRRTAIVQVAEASLRVNRIEQALSGRRRELSLGSLTLLDILNTVAELTEANIVKANIEYERDRLTYALLAALNRLRI